MPLFPPLNAPPLPLHRRQFHKDGKYDLDFKNPASNAADYITGEQLTQLYASFIDKFPSASRREGGVFG